MRLPNWLGDGVMSTPCIELLLARFPNAKLCLIAPKSILELFSADSRIYACFEDSTKKSKNRLKTTWQLGRAIRSKLEREGGVDIAITLTNHFYSALLLYACGARVRIGYKRGVGNMFLTHKLARAGGPHQVESYARLLDLLPQAESKTLDSSPKSAIPPLRLCAAPKQALDSKPLRIGLNPGAAYGSAKCWDKEHYARVGAHFAALGAEVVVYGVEADRELAEEIVASIDSALGKRDSALGEQCGSVAKIVKGTTAKVANLPQFLQSSHSPTATPRILGDTGQTELESKKLDSSSPSLRDTALAVAWQSISQTQSEATTQISPRLLYACENISAFYVAAYFPSDRVYFDANMFYTTPIEVALLAGKIDTCEYESLESRLKAFPRLFIDDDYGRWLLQLYKELFIHKIAKLWEKKDCIVIEGRYSSSGVYNDLFSNARSVLRINHLPHHNAYEHLDELKSYVQEVLSGFDPAHTCAILALGHSAKVLGFWLDGLGFRAFDIGSLSLNYDCFLYGADFYTYAGQGNPLELESYVLAPYIAGKRR